MLSQLGSRTPVDPRISPLTAVIRMPPSVPLNHYLELQKTNKIEVRGPIPLFHAPLFRRLHAGIAPRGSPKRRARARVQTSAHTQLYACFEHSNFFKVNAPNAQHTQRRACRAVRPVVPATGRDTRTRVRTSRVGRAAHATPRARAHDALSAKPRPQ